jgi:hypothetical protein
MKCDLCNTAIASGVEERIKPDVFTYLIDNGFALDQTNIQILTVAGMTCSDAERLLRDQYLRSDSDLLFCPDCAAEAKMTLTKIGAKWVDPNYLAVTQTAEEVGLGFDVIGAPVALSHWVWDKCVEWYDQDSERQTFQEKDARLWDVMFTGGGTLQLKVNEFLQSQIHRFSVQCIPRDGKSLEPVKINLEMFPIEIRGQMWLVIDQDESNGLV